MLTVSAKELAKAGSLLAPLAKSQFKPILANVFLRAEGGSVSLSATDLEASATVTIRGCETNGSATLLIPADKLFRFLASGGESLGISASGSRVELRLQSSKLSLPTENPKDYPSPRTASGDEFTVPCAPLRSASRIKFALAHSDTKNPALNGPAVVRHSGVIYLAAFNGPLVAIHQIGDSPGENFQKPLIPAILGMVGSLADCECKLAVGPNAAQFDDGLTRIVVSALEGAFPDVVGKFGAVIGEQVAGAHFTPETFLQSLAPALLASEADDFSTTVAVKADRLSISRSGKTGSGESDISCECHGEFSGEFSPTKLRDAVASFPRGISIEAKFGRTQHGAGVVAFQIENYRAAVMGLGD